MGKMIDVRRLLGQHDLDDWMGRRSLALKLIVIDNVRGRRLLWRWTLNFVQHAPKISVRTPATEIDIFLFQFSMQIQSWRQKCHDRLQILSKSPFINHSTTWHDVDWKTDGAFKLNEKKISTLWSDVREMSLGGFGGSLKKWRPCFMVIDLLEWNK